MTNITLSSSDTSSNLDEFPFPPYRINLDGYVVELIAPRAYDRYLDDRGFHVYELHRHSDKTRRYRGSTWWLQEGDSSDEILCARQVRLFWDLGTRCRAYLVVAPGRRNEACLFIDTRTFRRGFWRGRYLYPGFQAILQAAFHHHGCYQVSVWAETAR